MPQNRPYPTDQGPLMVKATFTSKDGVQTSTVFDWNKREDVRTFAARSDINLRAGGATLLGQMAAAKADVVLCPSCNQPAAIVLGEYVCHDRGCPVCLITLKPVQQTRPPPAWFPHALLQQPLDIQ